jgi:hypothetical protein
LTEGHEVKRTVVADEARYTALKEHIFATTERQFAYGKWLLNWLITLHAGSLIAISQAGDAKGKLYQVCGAFLIWGIVSGLGSGFFAWVNFTFAAQAYDRMSGQILSGQKPEPELPLVRIVRATLYFSVLCGIVSILLFVVAAFNATAALQ